MMMAKTEQSRLVFTDLGVNQPQELLKQISGEATSGDILAVMGPSGSGKTTLLNALAGRINITSGRITLNGSSFGKLQRRRLGYVIQDDVFLSHLTLWESLYFTAMISIPSSVSKEMKLKRIHNIVHSLGLEHCLHTVIGDIFTRGLSGGEKKRASIACELLRDTDILLVDEPTSGIDSCAAHSLMVLLKDYAVEYNKTLVVTIHQPSSQVYNMFSSLLLLLEGQVVYFGSAGSALDYLTSLEIPYENEYNPAEILLDAITSDSATVNTIKQGGVSKRYMNLQSHQDVPGGDKPIGTETRLKKGISSDALVDIVVDEADIIHRWPSSFWTQLEVLSWRSIRQVKGNLNLLDVAVPVVLAIIASLIFFRIGNDESSARDKFGLVFFVFCFTGFEMCLSTIRGLEAERAVVRKERSAGFYRLSSYYLSKMISELPLVFINPVIMITMIYWISGLGEAYGYVVFLSVGILHLLVMQSFSLVIGLCSSDLRFNTVAVFLILDTSLTLGGAYSVHPPEWLFWCKYLGFFHYPSAATMTYLMREFNPIRCNLTSIELYPQCAGNGNMTLTSRDVLGGLDIDLPVYFYVLIMVFVMCFFRASGYFVLKLKKF